MAYVLQFDTMHPSMTLGAFFNDRNFVCMSQQEQGEDSGISGVGRFFGMTMM